MSKQILFKDHPGGLQLHAGKFRGSPVWHSDDGGKTWWCGRVFGRETKVTQKELVAMAVSILRDAPDEQPADRADKEDGR